MAGYLARGQIKKKGKSLWGEARAWLTGGLCRGLDCAGVTPPEDSEGQHAQDFKFVVGRISTYP
jgi:hypothetical protein